MKKISMFFRRMVAAGVLALSTRLSGAAQSLDLNSSLSQVSSQLSSAKQTYLTVSNWIFGLLAIAALVVTVYKYFVENDPNSGKSFLKWLIGFVLFIIVNNVIVTVFMAG